MQPLELEITSRTREMQDARQRMRIVCRELQVQGIAGIESLSGAGQIRHIRMRFTRKDREARETRLLRMLDLGIPVGSLDQAHRNATPNVFRRLDKVTEHVACASLVSWHGDAEAFVVGEPGDAIDVVEQLERQRKAVGFLGVDRQADAAFLGMDSQFRELRAELSDDPVVLLVRETRMQG